MLKISFLLFFSLPPQCAAGVPAMVVDPATLDFDAVCTCFLLLLMSPFHFYLFVFLFFPNILFLKCLVNSLFLLFVLFPYADGEWLATARQREEKLQALDRLNDLRAQEKNALER